MSNQQPKFLRLAAPRLADWLDGGSQWPSYVPQEAAAALRRLHAEVLEQARLNGMGAEREARLMARVEQLERENEQIKQYAGALNDRCVRDTALIGELLGALTKLVEDLEDRAKDGVVAAGHSIYCNARAAIDAARSKT